MIILLQMSKQANIKVDGAFHLSLLPLQSWPPFWECSYSEIPSGQVSFLANEIRVGSLEITAQI